MGHWRLLKAKNPLSRHLNLERIHLKTMVKIKNFVLISLVIRPIDDEWGRWVNNRVDTHESARHPKFIRRVEVCRSQKSNSKIFSDKDAQHLGEHSDFVGPTHSRIMHFH